MINFDNYNPKFKVTARTWRGETYDLTNDVVVWSTTKTLTQPQGSFAIQLSANNSWDTKIKPIDYIEIRASANNQLIDGQYPIIMRGFVDYSGRSFSIGAVGGPNEPRVTIQGRDYSKLLLEWQVLYLFTQNNQVEIAYAQQNIGLLNFGISLIGASLPDFFDQVFSKLVSPVMLGLTSRWFNSLPDFKPGTQLPDYEMSSTPILSYTGSYWNLFSYFSSPPFGELFVRDEEDQTELIARVSPYRTIKGETPSPGTFLPTNIFVTTTEIQGYDAGFTDNDVYTYYLTWGDATQQNGGTMPLFTTTGNNGVNTDNQSLYGIRPLIIDTPWINLFQGSDTSKANDNILQVADELNEWLMAVMKDNASFRFGSMEMAGHEKYKIGEYMLIKEWNQEFYISSVSHTFTQYQRWDTQLGVVRGKSL